MHHSQTRRFISQGSVVIMTILSIGLAACGGGSSSSGNKALKLGTDLPVSSTDAGVALPTEHGADLAVSQNSDLGSGYTLTIVNKNDEKADGSGPDADLGKQNVQSLIDDPSVVAAFGPFNSGVAKVEMPLINAAGLTMISATTTNPGLTKQQFADINGITNFPQLHPAGKPEAYFRICGTDDIQGKVLAQVAGSPQVHAKNVFVVDDNTTYGKGLSKYFTDAYTAAGGKIAGTASITAQQLANIPGLATTILGTTPDGIFYGGVTSQGGAALKKALAAAGAAQLPMLGGDGIADDPKWITTATAAASLNTIGSIPAPDLSGLNSNPQVQKFVTDYKAKFNEDPLPYSLMAYDGAMLEIKAIKNIIAAGKTVTRASVRDEVAKISYPGLTGTISFDANGDNAGQKVFSIYAVTDTSGTWKFQTQVNG